MKCKKRKKISILQSHYCKNLTCNEMQVEKWLRHLMYRCWARKTKAKLNKPNK